MLNKGKHILISLSVVIALIVFFAGIAFASGALEADYSPGQFLVGIIAGERFSMEEVAGIFPEVEILQAKETAYYASTGQQLILLTLAAGNLRAMYDDKKALEQSPYVRYVSVNRLVQIPHTKPFDPKVTLSQDLDGVELVMELEKAQFGVDEETFRIRLTAKNNTSEPIKISSPHGGGVYFKFGTSRGGAADVSLVDIERYAMGFPAVVLTKIIEPGKDFSQTFTCALWRGVLEPALPGIYTIQAGLWNLSDSLECQIEIKAETADTGQLVGEVLYQSSPIPATVSLYNSAGILITETTTATDGAYALTVAETPQGADYTLVVTKPGYLSYTIKNRTLAELAESASINIRQLAGDVNGDGVINAVDLTYLLSEFNRKPVNNLAADIDGNGIVNAADLTYLLAGFNKRAVVAE